MRVNIQYSIEMDEIPEKVLDFLQGASSSSADIVHEIDDIVFCMEGNFSIDNTLKQIDKIRRDLANIDLTLIDCSEILHGYQKALVQLREPQKIEVDHDNETRNEEIEEG